VGPALDVRVGGKALPTTPEPPGVVRVLRVGAMGILLSLRPRIQSRRVTGWLWQMRQLAALSVVVTQMVPWTELEVPHAPGVCQSSGMGLSNGQMSLSALKEFE